MSTSPDPEETLALLRLHLATLYLDGLALDLLEHFPSARAVFAAGGVVAERRLRRGAPDSEGRLRRGLAARLDDTRFAGEAERELRRVESEGLGLLLHPRAAGVGYPTRLDALPSMPLVLFARGEFAARDELALGVIGSRRPTSYGRRQAERFAAALALRGFTIVSGLARGIDGEAQRAALASGGRTIAVLGSGLGRVYPAEHRSLAGRIVDSERGLLLSEFPFESPPRAFHFPRRNRILSGLSIGILVVEASLRSGSLHTVDWALAQDRQIWALPGPVDCEESLGTLTLIRDGAAPVLEPGDILAAVEDEAREAAAHALAPDSPAEPVLENQDEARVYARISESGGIGADELARALSLAAGPLLGILGELEARGLIEREVSGAYRRS